MLSFVTIFDRTSWCLLIAAVASGMTLVKLHHKLLIGDNRTYLSRAILKGFTKQVVLRNNKRFKTLSR